MSQIASIRRQMTSYINENLAVLSVYERKTKDNGFGYQIPDINGTPILVGQFEARVTRRRIPEPFITNTATPYDYQDVYYLLASHDADWLKQDLTFDYQGQRYRTLYPESRIIYGEVAYKVVNLEQVTRNTVETLS